MDWLLESFLQSELIARYLKIYSYQVTHASISDTLLRENSYGFLFLIKFQGR